MTAYLMQGSPKAPLLVPTPTSTGEITITTDKTEYEQGEMVRITVKNNSSKPIWYTIGSNSPSASSNESNTAIRIEQFNSNTWTPIVADCPCLACKGWSSLQWIKINPNGKLVRDWGQQLAKSDTICNIVSAESGKYKASVVYYEERESYELSHKIYSNEFAIKEKKGADQRCAQKAKGVGYCRGLWEGYEFDAKTGKCIKTRVSGCSAEVMPFNSLTECQSICEKSTTSVRELGFETVVKGSSSEISERKSLVTTSQTEWAQLLQKTREELPPPVDFTNDMLIAVSQGEHSTGGYSIEITKIVEKENNIEIFVKEIEPGPMCEVTHAFTYPYHIVKLQKNNKEVVLRVEKKITQCK